MNVESRLLVGSKRSRGRGFPSIACRVGLSFGIVLATGAHAAGDDAVAPYPPGRDIVWSHAPYEVGSCDVCHERNDAKRPGKIIRKNVNELCAGCHVDLQEMMQQPVVHFAAEDNCTNCHNPHNSRHKKLLKAAMPQLCNECHDQGTSKMKVEHGALTSGSSCAGCHTPHAGQVEHLLLQAPYDLCLSCHGTDDVVSGDGERLTNIKSLVESNPFQHGPVAAKDCTACHQPHGSDNMRLLVLAYPQKFYAPYIAENYALCFRCHNAKLATDPRTTSATGFRDGDVNLHYKHVNKAPFGRTCRACHEVHAAKKPHQIRDSVPFGTSGWMLPVMYTPTKTGGTCEKTCHAAKTYDNGGVRPAAGKTAAR